MRRKNRGVAVRVFRDVFNIFCRFFRVEFLRRIPQDFFIPVAASSEVNLRMAENVGQMRSPGHGSASDNGRIEFFVHL
jgi:hypothetical protein